MEYRHEDIRYDDLGFKFFYSEDQGSRISKHWHNSFEIIYLLDGSLQVELENTPYLLQKDDFILIHPRRIHSTACKTYNSAIVLQISFLFLQENIPEFQNILFSCTPADVSAGNAEAAGRVRENLKLLLKLYHKQPGGYLLKVRSVLFDLLFVLYQSFHIRQQGRFVLSEKYLQRLEQITSYVKKHYSEEITLPEVSKEVGLNPEYFSRFFKKYMSVTFTQYLNTIRLEHCCHEIVNSDCSISCISERNGFHNYKLFAKLFQYHYGCTPREKRKNEKCKSKKG